jgi:phosphoglycolate phosphatase-like HAD superfamily hydrolase
MRLMFDLDGTLTDSRLGVTLCFQHALADAGVVAPPIEELTTYVGPPLPASFATLDDRRYEGPLARLTQIPLCDSPLRG